MKILHVINSLETGGAEKLIIETLPLLNKTQDLEVDLAVLNALDYQFYTEFKRTNPTVKVIEISNGSIYNPLLIFKIIPLLRKYKIVHVHLFPSLYWVALAKFFSFSNSKLFFTEHNTSNRRLRNPIARLIDRFIYLFYDQVICISTEVKNQIEKLLKIHEKKLKVITNGINLHAINAEKPLDRGAMGYSSEDLLIIMVAAFRIEKDHETLLRAIAKLPAKYKLILVGDGERRKEIEDYIKSIQVEDRVKLLGIRNDVPRLLKTCDFAVISSYWEGFGLAAVEAMAAGTPVIASNVGGLNQVVENGGVLFEQGNENELVKNIINLSENGLKRQSIIDSGIRKAKEYDIQKMVDQTIQTYKNAFV